MTLFLLAAVLTLVVVVVLARPLLRDLEPPAASGRYNAAVYRDQLDELSRDAGRAVIADSEVAGARVEIERRLLATAREAATPASGPRRAPVLAAIVLTGVLVLAAGTIYLAVGDPGAPDQPLARTPGAATAGDGGAGAGPNGLHAQMDRMVSALADRLQAHPDDPDGWALLGRSLIRLDRPTEAVAAYQRGLAAAGGNSPQIEAEYAEARVIAANGAVDPETRALFQRVLAADPKSPQARYYLGLAKVQAGDAAGGLSDWKALAADSPKDAPWMTMLDQRIAEVSGALASAAQTSGAQASSAPSGPQVQAAGAQAAPGPTAADVDAAASLSEADRGRMIQSMVDGLARRLQRQPDDLDGWRRLARAYTVLGRPAEAADAERHVLRLAPGDPDATRALAGR